MAFNPQEPGITAWVGKWIIIPKGLFALKQDNILSVGLKGCSNMNFEWSDNSDLLSKAVLCPLSFTVRGSVWFIKSCK